MAISWTPRYDAQAAEKLTREVDHLFETAASHAPDPSADQRVLAALKAHLQELEGLRSATV